MLQLVLKTEFFNLIESGDKFEEYREIGAYWSKRLFHDGKVKHREVMFYDGYRKDRRKMIFKIRDVLTGWPNPDWIGDMERKEMYVIILGDRIN